MSINHRPLYAILKDIEACCRFHCNGMKYITTKSYTYVYYEEACLANSAFRLIHGFAELKSKLAHNHSERLAPLVYRSIRGIHRILTKQIGRWGWANLTDADGLDWGRKRIEEHHQNKEIPVLRAWLSLISKWHLTADSIRVREIELVKVDSITERAIELGLEPDPALDQERILYIFHERNMKFLKDPALGRIPPECSDEELVTFRLLTNDISVYFKSIERPSNLDLNTEDEVRSSSEDGGVPKLSDARTDKAEEQSKLRSKESRRPKYNKEEELVEARRYIRDCIMKGKIASVRGLGEIINRSNAYVLKIAPMRIYIDENKSKKSTSVGTIPLPVDARGSDFLVAPKSELSLEQRVTEFRETAPPDGRAYINGITSNEELERFLALTATDRQILIDLLNQQNKEVRSDPSPLARRVRK